MKLFCTLNKNEILSEVNKITSYTGKQVEEEFDKIATTEDEENLTGSLYDKAILQLLSSFVAYRPLLEDGVTFDVPETFEMKSRSAIERGMRECLINEICAQWFKITKPDEVEYYLLRAVGELDNLKTYFNMRVKPVRRPIRPMGF